jgi:hypothetical protein
MIYEPDPVHELEAYSKVDVEMIEYLLKEKPIRRRPPMDKKAAMELRFGKGPEHEELCDLFAEFAFQLDRRLPDGDLKNAMLSYLDHASEQAHQAVKETYSPVTEIDRNEVNISHEPMPASITNLPKTLAETVHRAEIDAIRNYDSGGLKRKGVEFKSPIQDDPPVIDE